MLDNTLLHELMARSALRDQRAFAELYRHTCAKLFGVALRIVRRQDWAEEVLQESFVSIWNHAEGYSSSKSAQMTWMTAIVRNRALDWLRRPHFEVASDDYQLLLESVADEGDGPELLLSKDREGRALAECMKQLSSKQRQSIALAYTHGLSHGNCPRISRNPWARSRRGSGAGLSA